MTKIAYRSLTAVLGLVPLLLCILSLPSCATAIGDDCSNDAQCPVGAYCDKTMPGGMCTQSPCRPDQCPEESVCVKFDNGESFCMLRCDSDDDCRDGYACMEGIGLWPFCSVRQ